MLQQMTSDTPGALSETDRRDEHAVYALNGALALLWDAMRQAGIWECRIGDQRHRVHHITDVARANGVLPERLLRHVKESWGALPEVRRAPQPFIADERRDRIIAACIDEYFANRAPAGDDASNLNA